MTSPAQVRLGRLDAGLFLLACRGDPAVRQVTVWTLYLVPALGLFLAPVGFGRSRGRGKGGGERVTAADEGSAQDAGTSAAG
ncbi:hypothetical protein [Streptomyces sp. NPDC088923]|uniref:hypothetical protein n=1 Tax=Streptomyces sp. NPDC088923 TaxID=3365913 RepID=UPI003827B135